MIAIEVQQRGLHGEPSSSLVDLWTAVRDDLGDSEPGALIVLAFHFAAGAIAIIRGETHPDHAARNRHLELALVHVSDDGARCSEVACSAVGALAVVLATGAIDRFPTAIA